MRTKYLPLITLAACVALAGMWGCNRWISQRPNADQIYSDSPDFSASFQVAKSGIDWNHFHEAVIANEQSLRAQLGNNGYTAVDQISSKAEHIESVSIDISGFPNALETESDSQTLDWAIAINIKLPIPAIVLEEAINRHKNSDIELVKQAPVGEFNRYFVLKRKNQQYLCELLLWSRENTQLRIGTADRLLESIDRKVNMEFHRSEAFEPNARGWIQLETPEPLLQMLSELESQLPFDPGTLLRGLTAWCASYTLEDQIFSATNGFIFEDGEQAGTAFSYLQLATALGIKPLLRNQLGKKASFFTRSINNELLENRVSNNFKMTENDLEAVSDFVRKTAETSSAEIVLELIQPDSR
jgi:hypothetical protein